MVVWLPNKHIVIAAIGLGLALAMASHLFVKRARVFPDMACVGHTVFINELVGIAPYEPDFEASAQGLLDDPASKRYLNRVARHAINQIYKFEERDRNALVCVHLIPFQSPITDYFKGWPLRTTLPFSEVFIRTTRTNKFDSKPFYFVLSTAGTRQISYSAFGINWVFFVVLILVLITARNYLTFSSRRAQGLCVSCGYDPRGNETETCPECGDSTRPK